MRVGWLTEESEQQKSVKSDAWRGKVPERWKWSYLTTQYHGPPSFRFLAAFGPAGM